VGLCGGVYRVHKHARHGGVSRRGRGRQPIRQAATSTATAASVFQLARASPISTSPPTSTSTSDIMGWLRDFFLIGITYLIPSLRHVLLTRQKPFFQGRLLTNPPDPTDTDGLDSDPPTIAVAHPPFRHPTHLSAQAIARHGPPPARRCPHSPPARAPFRPHPLSQPHPNPRGPPSPPGTASSPSQRPHPHGWRTPPPAPACASPRAPPQQPPG
jgi:hypothetical protein